MENTTLLLTAITGTGATVIACGIGTLMFFARHLGERITELRTDMKSQFAETNNRLQHIETRIDDTNQRIDEANHRIHETNGQIRTVARDIADLRDRTGKLEGSLTTFMAERRNTSAA